MRIELKSLTLYERPAVGMFDSEARISCVREAVCLRCESQLLVQPRKFFWQGRPRIIESAVLARIVLNGQSLITLAYVCDELGCDESGTPIDLLIGSLALKAWDVNWDADQRALGFTRVGQIIDEFSDLAHCRLAA